ncbi:MAG: aldo/keto reductase [Acidobacteriaceae bacterium]|nr:aldo/keto reductase [Acidobacteriaceae bacterium]MBV9780901.1 aldo/keto reductase [Acidobacteriaceae bacterium]
MPVPHRELKGVSVSIIGIGGFSLGDVKDDSEVGRIVSEAVENGINFFDNAWEYHNGMSEERMGRALKGKRDQVFLMTKVCSHGRKRDVAIKMLEDSLRRLQTDHLDLWQIHEVIYDNDPDLHFAPDGAVEALTQAKQQGKARFVGFTGHKDPDIHLKMLSHQYAFDTVQLPLNPFDKNYRSFQQRVIPEARRQNIAVIGMKSMGGGGEPVKRGVATPQELLRYAMSVPGILTTVSGMDSYDVFRQNLAIAMNFTPMNSGEMAALENRVKALAGDGRLEHYKATKLYDAAVGREQHGFPSPKELPA